MSNGQVEEYISSFYGHEIDDSVGKRYLSGSTDPTTSTVGKLGQHYFNTNTKKDYICTGVSGSVYTWILSDTDTVTSINGKTGAISKSDITALGIPSQDTTYSEATTSIAGLMSASDKTKLDGVAANADVSVNSDWNASSGKAQILNKPTIPSVVTVVNNLTSTSTTNALSAAQGKALNDNKLDKSGGTMTGQLSAQANTAYTTYQVRNIALSTTAATPTGNGSLLGVYS